MGCTGRGTPFEEDGDEQLPIVDAEDVTATAELGPVMLKVKLTAQAHTALVSTAKIAGHSRTDTVNRALQILAFIEERKAAGWDLGFSREPGEFRPYKID